MIGIYKITSPSNKVYIGQTWNSEKRFNNYKNLYCKTQVKLYRSFVKYGFDLHKIEIIHELPEGCIQEVMDRYEEFYLNQCKTCGLEMMNLREPGSRGKHSEESKQKMRDNWNRPSLSKEKRVQIGENLKKYYRLNGTDRLNKPVIQKDLNGVIIKEWKSAREAATTLNIKYKGISAVATSKNGRYKTYKGFIWMFK